MSINANVWVLNPKCPACVSGVAAMRQNDQRQAMVQAEAMKKIRALTAEVEALRADAGRWRWLRQQGGWPDSEAAVGGFTPREFDKMADAASAAGRE
jgi:hypothetical protein